eukprot:tig00020693_g13030.t1
MRQVRRLSAEAPEQPLPRRPDDGGAIERFEAWLRDQGVELDGLRLVDFPGFGVGLQTTRKIEKGDRIGTVPLRLLMTNRTARTSRLGRLLEGAPAAAVDDASVMALHVLCEDADPSSFWRAYLDTLPKTFTTPLFFSEEEIDLLQCPRAMPSARKQQRRLKAAYESCRPLLEDSFPPSHRTFEKFRWAWSVLFTRAYWLEPDLFGSQWGLVPFADALNHCCEKNDSYYDEDEKAYVCLAGSSFAAGKQVFVNYGPYDNWRLLKWYGFVVPGNPSDHVKFSPEAALLGPIQKEEEATPKDAVQASLEKEKTGADQAALKRRILEENGMLGALGVRADGKATPNLKRGLWLAFSRRGEGETEAEWAKRAERLAAGEEKVRGSVHRRAWAHLAALCKAALRGYPTTEAEDETVLAGAGGGGVPPPAAAARLAVQWRLEQKRILRRFVEAAEAGGGGGGRPRAKPASNSRRSGGNPAAASGGAGGGPAAAGRARN